MIAGVLYWLNDSGPRIVSGGVPFPPKPLQYEKIPKTWGGHWTINYYYFYDSAAPEIMKAPYLINQVTCIAIAENLFAVVL